MTDENRGQPALADEIELLPPDYIAPLELAECFSTAGPLETKKISVRKLRGPRDEIAKGGNFEASVAQDFKGIGAATADAVVRVLGGETIKQRVIYVPTKLVTSANAKE